MMAKAKIDGTTEQQKLFAYAYHRNGGNATHAAIEAGYSAATATPTASRLLTYVNVKALILELNAKLKEDAIVSKEQIVRELAKIGFSDIREVFDENSRLLSVKDWPDDVSAAIGSVEVDQLWAMGLDGKEEVGETKKIKRESKLQALKQLTEIYGYNAPVKSAATDASGEDVTHLSDTQFEKLLNAINAPSTNTGE